MPLFKGVEIKIQLNNFLILNNQHQGGISFTFLKSLKHSSISMIEVCVFRSFTIIFYYYYLNSLFSLLVCHAIDLNCTIALPDVW